MDKRAAAIVKNIEKQRERLGDDIARLERKVRERADWRVYFAKRPWLAVSLAVAGGFLFSGLLHRGSR